MLHIRWIVLLTCFGCSSALAAPKLKERPLAQTIVGEWVADDGGPNQTFTDGGELLIGKNAPAATFRFVVNTKANPATLDMIRTHNSVPVTWSGIFKVDGDKLTICLNLKGDAARPLKLEKSDDSLISLQTFTRRKTKD